MIEKLLGSPAAMLDQIYDQLAQRKLPLNLPCDHVCYRVATQARYEELRDQLTAHGTLASEAIIAGRPIASFALFTPIIYKGQQIPCLELPAPKPGSDYAEGWEHAEFVTGEPLTQFMTKHPQVQFNTKAINKPHNPEISLMVDAKTAVKFHPEPLLTVIETEKRLGLA